ncbi:uroporphyrinogen-III synthase [Oceanobacillus salinisoli]|uniref:uroporphyrinogen-III synthase n=1 Tax=Oceanobacillus salinisoli TaxID=2678611 RepID=UPI0012E0EF33|nr:uroporphyrinogen-III synthase [Oceanobacillus salinisoli]
MKGLSGKKVAIAAARQANAIDILIKKHDGEAFHFPIQGEYQLNELVCKQDVKELVDKSFDMVILTTGIGADTLEQSAQKLNIHAQFIEKLRMSTLAIRGSKTCKWMKKHALTPHYVSEDGTMNNLIKSLPAVANETEKRIYLQTYNEDDVELKSSLKQLGYEVYLSKPYSYKEPDSQLLAALKETILKQTVHAVIFTSKTQVRNLFSSSDRDELAAAFNDHVLAVAVGKVTAAELENSGIENVLQPMEPKMGAMIVELSKQFADH